MFKKILVGLLMVGVVGVLVYGAMNRTIVKAYNEDAVQQRGRNSQDASELIAEQGRGRNRQSEQELAFGEEGTLPDSTRNGGNGWESAELIVERGRGNSKESEQEFVLNKETTLSDPGRRGGNGRDSAELIAEDRGRYGQSEQDKNQSSEAVLADVKGWLYLDGIVSQVTDEEIVIVIPDNELITMGGRPLSFAQSIGFTADVGDQLQIKGFYEGDEVEIGEITNVATGQMFVLRSEEGRPLWAGKGGMRGGKV